MHERDRNRQLAKGLATQGYLPTLLVDWSFGSEYPCDILVCCPGGVYWAIESKAVEIPSWTSKQSLLGPRSFRERQLPNLLQVAEQGGRASVVLFVSPPRAIDTRAWLLSARGVASMLQQDRILRLIDLSDPVVDEFELVRLPKGTWGLGEQMLKRLSTKGLLLSHEHGWHIPDKSSSAY